METVILVLRCVAGPLLGAIIGYITNWLAVKMLFRPHYPKMIGKWRLPFTPGIIPKRRAALAKAVGTAVGEQLFTKDDLSSVIVSENAKQKVANLAVELWNGAGDSTANEIIEKYVSENGREELKENARNFLTDRIYAAVNEFNVGAMVAAEGVKMINGKKASLGMLAMFLSDDLIRSLANKISEGVNGYVKENGRKAISEAVKTELEKAFNSPLAVVTEKVEADVIKSVAARVYESVVKSMFAELADELNVSAVVEEKLNVMDIKELEKLVLSVMKKELNAIVSLGAFLGFVLGLIMIVFNFI